MNDLEFFDEAILTLAPKIYENAMGLDHTPSDESIADRTTELAWALMIERSKVRAKFAGANPDHIVDMGRHLVDG